MKSHASEPVSSEPVAAEPVAAKPAVALPDYPTAAQAMACIPTLLDILRGKVAVADDAKALWVIAGYGLSVGLTTQPHFAHVPQFLSYGEAATHVEAELGRGGLAGLNWGGLLKIVLPILLQLLPKA